MPFLSENDRGFLKNRFASELKRPVMVKLFSEPVSGLYVPGMQQCVTCADTEALMREVSELSDLIELEIHNVKEDPASAAEWEVTATPTIAVFSEKDTGIRFLGLPSGYEFTSFIETVVSIGSGSPPLTEDSLAKLEELDVDLDIKVFSTPT